jgi:uncharacterized surface protein with fasciclin (FAS1) repeats
MKKWTSLVSLCALFFGIQINAQDIIETSLQKVLAQASTSEISILERTASFENQSTWHSALIAANLDKVLAYRGEFTVFAPSNQAFEKLSPITISKLYDPKNKTALKAMLSYHIIAGKLSASTILRAMSRGKGSAKFTTMQGEKITATMSGIDIVLTDKAGNKAIIVTADSNQSNGIIHEIDAVFLPKRML